MTASWAPSLDDVAKHIPTRTRDTRTPGSDKLLGTFTEATTPTAEQAQSVIDDAVNNTLMSAGLDPATAYVPEGSLAAAARQAAEWRAAADIEIAYPLRDADVRTYQFLAARADQALVTFRQALTVAGGSEVGSFPVWSAPDPPPYADLDPGDYTPVLPRGWLGGPRG